MKQKIEVRKKWVWARLGTWEICQVQRWFTTSRWKGSVWFII